MSKKILIISEDTHTAKTIAQECMDILGEAYSFIHCPGEKTTVLQHQECAMAIIDLDLINNSGFQLAAIIHNANPDACVLFCSKQSNLVFDAFQYHMFYFIRKSHLKQDLRKAIKMYDASIREKPVLVLQKRKEIIRIDHNEIIYCIVEGNYIRFVLMNGVYRHRMTMRSLETQLDSQIFQRSDRGTLLNVNHIAKMERTKARLDNGEWVCIADKQYESLLESFQQCHFPSALAA